MERLNDQNLDLKRPLEPSQDINKPLKRSKPNEESKLSLIKDTPKDDQTDTKKDSHLTYDNYIKIYTKICEKLLSKNTPKMVNFRTKEKTKLKNFLAQQLATDRKSLSTLIVSGKPGGGKTLLIQNLLKEIKNSQWQFFDFLKTIEISKEKKLKKIQILEINAMKYSSCFPFLLDTIAWIFKIAGIKFNPKNFKNGLYLLEKFKSCLKDLLADNYYVILVDELDTLATHDRKDFDVIIEFLNIEFQGFVKIGISNTLDLFATYKGTKNYLNSKKLVFKPYSVNDLNGILRERIEEAFVDSETDFTYEDLIQKNVFTFICKKIYKNESGDIRAMLNIARSIFDSKVDELKKREEGVKSKISMSDAINLISEKYQDKTMDLIKNMSISHQLCVFTLYFSISSGDDSVSMKDYKKELGNCKTELNLNARFNLDEVLETLRSYGILRIEKKASRSLYGNIKILSLYKKYELKDYLVQIQRFKRFIVEE